MTDLMWRTYDELTKAELYSVLALRAQVFVVEQGCPYQDVDGKDQASMHLLLHKGDTLAGYLRFFGPGKYHHEQDNLHEYFEGATSFGRLVVDSSCRGKSLGAVLVKEALAYSTKQHPGVSVAISGQCYLERFYANLGFETKTEPYLEDGIKHVAMMLQPSVM
jgi:ElaA protein